MNKLAKQFFAFVAVLGLAGCSKKHDHNYVFDHVDDPTLTSDGYYVTKCSICGEEHKETIPHLNDKDYTVSTVEASCLNPGYDLYSSEKYGEFKNITSEQLDHSTYDGVCEYCDHSINNFTFSKDTIVKINAGGNAYPRLLALESEEDVLLCVYEQSGKCVIKRSEDNGATWSKRTVTASFHDEVVCGNPILFEAKDGTIYCGYRALARSSDANARNIYSSVSYDGGETFEDFAVVEDIYDLGYTRDQVAAAVRKHGGIGFFEPFFGYINDKLVCMYADDATPMLEDVWKNASLNYACQRLVYKELIDGEWTNRTVVMDGAVEKSINEISLAQTSRDGMPEFAQLSDGTYVLVFEGTYRRASNYGSNPFEILISYSKDGKTWSQPIEVFQPHGNTTKASAPDIEITKDDRLIISFQTDEDCYAAGKGIGDGVSIMKVIISDGTPVDKLTKENFYEAKNPFFKEPGQQSVWTGMMLKDDTLYCVAGDGSVIMNTAEVPLRAEPIHRD